MIRQLFVFGVSAILWSQDPSEAQPWRPLLMDPASGQILLQVQIINSSKGEWSLRFRNPGTQDIHFDYWVPGPQTADDSTSQGRIHLQPLADTDPIVIPSAKYSITHSPSLVRIRLGDDSGSYWRE
jgi:hypothetical protein